MSPVDESSIPPLVFQQYMNDLGDLDENRSSGAAGFVFENASNWPVHINKITPSCGCLTTRIAHLDYPPGSEGEFFIQIDSAGESSGPKRFDAVVSYETRDNDGKPRHQYEEKVWFKVTIPQKKLIVEPAAVIIYQAANGTPTRRMVQLMDSRDAEYKILSVESSHPQVHVNVIGPRPTNSGPKIQEVELVVQGTFPEKPTKAVINIQTDDSVYRSIRVPMLLQGMKPVEEETTPE